LLIAGPQTALTDVETLFISDSFPCTAINLESLFFVPFTAQPELNIAHSFASHVYNPPRSFTPFLGWSPKAEQLTPLVGKGASLPGR
jgi:hypothetical protein